MSDSHFHFFQFDVIATFVVFVVRTCRSGNGLKSLDSITDVFGQMDGSVIMQMSGCQYGWVDGWVDGWVCGWMGMWMGGYVDGWMGEWMGEWMGG